MYLRLSYSLVCLYSHFWVYFEVVLRATLSYSGVLPMSFFVMTKDDMDGRADNDFLGIHFMT